MSDTISQLKEILLQLDALKAVNRRNYINGGDRVENSAEHSWHVAMACWIFAEHFDEDVDLLKLIQLALIHDLGEIEAGDTFLYSLDRHSAHLDERQGVQKFAAMSGNPLQSLVALWDEQQQGATKEARLLKVVDRILPLLHNLSSEGRAWRDHEVAKSQVVAMNGFIEHDHPEIFRWIIKQLDWAVDQGWLIDG